MNQKRRENEKKESILFEYSDKLNVYDVKQIPQGEHATCCGLDWSWF